MRQVHVVVGGQFGSEAKGAVAGYLASQEQAGDNVVCVRVGGPNAGHTVYGRCPHYCTEAHRMFGDEEFARSHPHPWRLRQVPVAAVTNPNATLLIAAGSEVDMNVLWQECQALAAANYKVGERLYIDRSATLLEERHITQEQASGLNGQIGSTAKGIGAARSERLWRSAKTVGCEAELLTAIGISLVDSTKMLTSWLEGRANVVIEGTQGYGLGLHTKYYPQVTSGDCRAIDFLAQSGLSPWSYAVEDLNVWVVARTYPIRVAGNSGPLSGELSWEGLGLEPEKTTVTQKIRRVGEWDSSLVRNAVLANGGGDYNPKVKLALMMIDYKIPEMKGVRNLLDVDQATLKQFYSLVQEVEREVGATVGLVGTSPVSIVDMR